jgi:hypothetical protein
VTDEERFNQLRRKFHPLLMEMDRRHVRLIDLEMPNGLLYISGEAGTPEDLNYVWDEIRAIDPDLVDISAEITVGRGATGEEKAADREIYRSAIPDPTLPRQRGDRGGPNEF